MVSNEGGVVGVFALIICIILSIPDMYDDANINNARKQMQQQIQQQQHKTCLLQSDQMRSKGLKEKLIRPKGGGR